MYSGRSPYLVAITAGLTRLPASEALSFPSTRPFYRHSPSLLPFPTRSELFLSCELKPVQRSKIYMKRVYSIFQKSNYLIE